MSKKHWTSRSADDFRYRIASDFVMQVEKAMEDRGMSQSDLSGALGITPGRVSQLINNPGNLTLSSIVKWASVLGLKVSVVAYSDGDLENLNGPIPSEIFAKCWEERGKPKHFWELEPQVPSFSTTTSWDKVPYDAKGLASERGPLPEYHQPRKSEPNDQSQLAA